MPQQRWTLLVLSDDEAAVRQFRITRERARFMAAAALAIVAVLSVLAFGFLTKEGQQLRAMQLARENEALTVQVARIQDRLATLQDTLQELSRRDEHYRLLAGLEPIDEEVRLAGIGGPGTATLESNPLWQISPRRGEMTFAAAYDLNAMLRRTRMLVSSLKEATDTLSAKYERYASLPSIAPTEGYVSSVFNQRRWHPILHRFRPHEGLDIAAPRGTPILAAANGRVRYIGWKGDYGRTVEIDHGRGIVTRYAHTSKILVKWGQAVKRGDTIAEVGDTGLTTATHLHYEVLVDGRPKNPRTYIIDGAAIPD